MRKKQIANILVRNCSKSRKRKLQELYFATVSKVSQHTENDARVHNSKGEAAFLEANNILEYGKIEYDFADCLNISG